MMGWWRELVRTERRYRVLPQSLVRDGGRGNIVRISTVGETGVMRKVLFVLLLQIDGD